VFNQTFTVPFFSIDELTKLMRDAGLHCNTCDYVQRETVNKKEGLCVPRIFVQAKFIKDLHDDKEEHLDNSISFDEGKQHNQLSNVGNELNFKVTERGDNLLNDIPKGDNSSSTDKLDVSHNISKTYSDIS